MRPPFSWVKTDFSLTQKKGGPPVPANDSPKMLLSALSYARMGEALISVRKAIAHYVAIDKTFSNRGKQDGTSSKHLPQR
jgi:hypothetical protein